MKAYKTCQLCDKTAEWQVSGSELANGSYCDEHVKSLQRAEIERMKKKGPNRIRREVIMIRSRLTEEVRHEPLRSS